MHKFQMSLLFSLLACSAGTASAGDALFSQAGEHPETQFRLSLEQFDGERFELSHEWVIRMDTDKPWSYKQGSTLSLTNNCGGDIVGSSDFHKFTGAGMPQHQIGLADSAAMIDLNLDSQRLTKIDHFKSRVCDLAVSQIEATPLRFNMPVNFGERVLGFAGPNLRLYIEASPFGVDLTKK